MMIETANAITARGDIQITRAEETKERIVRNPQSSDLETLESKNVSITELSKSINAVYDPQHYNIRFSKFEDTNKVIVNVYDKNTDDLVRQIPPEELLKMQQRLDEYTGNFVDTKA